MIQRYTTPTIKRTNKNISIVTDEVTVQVPSEGVFLFKNQEFAFVKTLLKDNTFSDKYVITHLKSGLGFKTSSITLSGSLKEFLDKCYEVECQGTRLEIFFNRLPLLPKKYDTWVLSVGALLF